MKSYLLFEHISIIANEIVTDNYRFGRGNLFPLLGGNGYNGCYDGNGHGDGFANQFKYNNYDYNYYIYVDKKGNKKC
jgi:hypothetical protein